jgi:hypothetical protein
VQTRLPRRFLFEISGCTIPVAIDEEEVKDNIIIVGKNKKLKEIGVDIDLDEFGEEGFTIKTVGPHLVLAGARLRGTLYAVYTFLEKLGCRWYTPTVSRIPRKTSIIVEAMDEKHEPSFEWRMISYPRSISGDRDWSARNRVNGEAHRLDKATGGNFLIKNTSSSRGFYELVPPDKYFEEHPELYSIVDGKRRGPEWPAQLCLTNPDVVKIVTDYVLNFFEQNPEYKAYGIIQNDWAGWCECPECQAIIDREEANSGTLVHFINKVAEEVEKKFPDKLIYLYSYTVTVKAPKNIKTRRNVIVAASHMHPSCSSHPVTGCEKNLEFMNTVKAWKKIAEKLYIKHYAVDYFHYMLPFPNFYDISGSAAFYKDAGAEGIHFQGATSMVGGGGEFEELRAYFVAKMMWDAHADTEEIIDDFMRGYYGNAAAPIRQYFDMLHAKVIDEHIHMHLYSGPEAGYLTPEVIQQAIKYFDDAERLADNEEILDRVKKTRLSIQYARLVMPMRYALLDGYVYPVPFAIPKRRLEIARARGLLKPVLDEYLEERKQLVEKFITSVEKFGIRYHTEEWGGKGIGVFLDRVKALNEKYPALCIDEFDKPVIEAMEKLEKWIAANGLPKYEGEIRSHELRRYMTSIGLDPRATIAWLDARKILDRSDIHLWLRRYTGRRISPTLEAPDES